jgi:hypothetical protein
LLHGLVVALTYLIPFAVFWADYHYLTIMKSGHNVLRFRNFCKISFPVLIVLMLIGTVYHLHTFIVSHSKLSLLMVALNIILISCQIFVVYLLCF